MRSASKMPFFRARSPRKLIEGTNYSASTYSFRARASADVSISRVGGTMSLSRARARGRSSEDELMTSGLCSTGKNRLPADN